MFPHMNNAARAKIARHMARTGMTPAQIADSAGIPRSVFYRFMSGKRGLSLKSTVLLVRHFKGLIRESECMGEPEKQMMS